MSKQILDLKCSFFLLSLWFFSPLRSILDSFVESSHKVGNKLSDIHIFLCRKSVMAFHNAQSIPPLEKDTRTQWREHICWKYCPWNIKWLLSFHSSDQYMKIPKSYQPTSILFVYIFSPSLHAFLFYSHKTTESQSSYLLSISENFFSIFIFGHTWKCSGVISGSAFRDYSWW